ncbi:MAG: rod-binding protein [Bdellovibrionales bacterium]
MGNVLLQGIGDLAIQQATGPSDMGRLAHKSGRGDVDQTSREFEGMFLAQMLQPMFQTVGVDPIFGGGHGEEVMRGLLVQEYGKAIAQRTSFGIAGAVRAHLIRAQEMQEPAAGSQPSANPRESVNAQPIF